MKERRDGWTDRVSKHTMTIVLLSFRQWTKNNCILKILRGNRFLNPFPNHKVQTFQTEFADENFKFDANGRKFSKWVENTVGKGEIAHYEQFLLFPQSFQKTCTAAT